jgi:hypothetical protein
MATQHRGGGGAGHEAGGCYGSDLHERRRTLTARLERPDARENHDTIYHLGLIDGALVEAFDRSGLLVVHQTLSLS